MEQRNSEQELGQEIFTWADVDLLREAAKVWPVGDVFDEQWSRRGFGARQMATLNLADRIAALLPPRS